MTDYFLDSSALAKRYLPEVGSTWVRSITSPSASNTIIIAQITRAEVVSGVMRRSREGIVSARIAHAIRLLIDRHASREYLEISLSATIVGHAETLLEAYVLRAYDAIQLASALSANTHLISAGLSPLVFVSADVRLLTVAATEKLSTDDPNAHP